MNQVVATITSEEDIQEITRIAQDEGECCFGTTFWQGKHAIRLSFSSWATTESDIERTLEAITRATRSVLSEAL